MSSGRRRTASVGDDAAPRRSSRIATAAAAGADAAVKVAACTRRLQEEERDGSGGAPPSPPAAAIDGAAPAYSSAQAMWTAELAPLDEATGELQWYRRSKAYWEAVPATVDGMLGGFPHLSAPDVLASRSFLRSLPIQLDFASSTALDVGAGIGRVSKNLLLPLFARVDLADSDARYIAQSRAYVRDARVDRRLHCAMEKLRPEAGRYALVWIQWCIMYLTDDDLVRLLHDSAAAVRAQHGVLCVKDNICSGVDFVHDASDSSVTRSDAYLRTLFERAQLKLVAHRAQRNFPPDLFPVHMYALQLRS